jgi:4-amino-4-deoxy-L-arabinose transferase-like glycosyltransferase
VPALALGGEAALTLWTMLSGWAAAGLLYVVARRHLSLSWSLAVALALLTAPAVVYGAGSGQVEMRIALFALAAAWAAGRALATEDARYAALAGLAAGFAAGAKYTGLAFAAAAGAVLLLQRRRLRHGFAFAAGAVAFGWQWYWWNWLNAGDPLFPLLFDWLGVRDPSFWNADQHALFKEAWPQVELPLSRAPWNLLAYPFLATFAPFPAFDSGRTGLGPYGALILPFAVLGAWRLRERIRRDALFAFAAIAVLFYVLWFLSGSSQRVRHLLPVYPLLLVPLTAAAVRLAERGPALKPLALAVAGALTVQALGHGLFALNHWRRLALGESRDSFLARTVEAFAPVPWINANLGPSDRLLVTDRTLLYLIDVPLYFAHDLTQARIDMLPGRSGAAAARRQLERLGVTHLLLSAPAGAQPYLPPFESLRQAGCLDPLRSFEGRRVLSRTLPTPVAAPDLLQLLAFRPERCRR